MRASPRPEKNPIDVSPFSGVTVVADLAPKPRPGVAPLSVCGCAGHPDDRDGLFDRQPAEEVELDYLGRLGVFLR
jgi:hypothetical protein